MKIGQKVPFAPVTQFCDMDFTKRLLKMETLAKRLSPRKANKAVPNIYLREYATWKSVYDVAAPSLETMIAALKEFNAADLLQTLSKISFISQYELGFNGEIPPLSYFKDFIDKDVLQNLSKRRDISKICLGRSQILFLQLMTLRYSMENGGKPANADLLGVGRLLLLSGSYCEGGSITDEQGRMEKDSIKGNMVRNLVFNANERLQYKLPRYWHIITQIQNEVQRIYPKEVFPFNKTIIDETGATPQEICEYTFAVLCHYFKDEKEEILRNPGNFLIGPDYFKNVIPKNRAGADRRLQDLSKTHAGFIASLPEDISKGGYDTRPIHGTPLYKLSTNSFFLLDLKSLLDNCTEGVFWMAFNKTAPGSKERKQLRCYWGRLLERYANHILQSYFPTTFLAPRLYIGDEEDFSGVDFIVIDPESAIFIEVTNSPIPILKLLSADWSEQKKSLDYILFKTQDGKAGKAYKIANAIKEFRAGRLHLRGIDQKTIKMIYPVLVMERGFPQLPPITSELRNEIATKTGMVEAEHFEIWDIEELEACQSVFRAGMSNYIRQKHDGEHSEWPMQNFLSAIKVDTHNDYTTKIFDDATNAMMALLWKQNGTGNTDAREQGT